MFKASELWMLEPYSEDFLVVMYKVRKTATLLCLLPCDVWFIQSRISVTLTYTPGCPGSPHPFKQICLINSNELNLQLKSMEDLLLPHDTTPINFTSRVLGSTQVKGPAVKMD